MTETNKKVNPEALKESDLQWILCIYYSAQFGKYFIKILIDSASKIITMQPSFMKKLGLCIYKTNMGAQKINDNRLETFKILIILF